MSELSKKVQSESKKVWGDMLSRFTKTRTTLGPATGSSVPELKSETCSCEGNRTLWIFTRAVKERIVIAVITCESCGKTERRPATEREQRAHRTAFVLTQLSGVQKDSRLLAWKLSTRTDKDLDQILKLASAKLATKRHDAYKLRQKEGRK